VGFDGAELLVADQHFRGEYLGPGFSRKEPMLARVFLIQPPTANKSGWVPDLSSATRYGAIVNVLGPEDQPSLSPGPCLRKIRYRLKDFTEDDYILFAGGDPAAMLLVGVALRDGITINRFAPRSIKLLRWERERDQDGRRTKMGAYLPTEVALVGAERKEVVNG
jgi:hypothetical protein